MVARRTSKLFNSSDGGPSKIESRTRTSFDQTSPLSEEQSSPDNDDNNNAITRMGLGGGGDDSQEDSQGFELGEDVYSLLFISPVCSGPFIFAAATVCLKLALFTFLAIDLQQTARDKREEIGFIVNRDTFGSSSTLIRATQFCLMPVAVAIQEDLIYVYTRVANGLYDKTWTSREETKHATESKFFLSFFLRFLDGIYSLIINFTLLLITTEVLGIFLNFAALQFLQSIDDIAFQFAANGYLGDEMEDLCEVVTRTILPKRVGDSFTNSLDSLLFLTTYGVMLAVWSLHVYLGNNPTEN